MYMSRRPFSLLHQIIGRIYHFWVEYQEVLRPFSLSHFERSIRAQEPLLKNERSINACLNYILVLECEVQQSK